MKASIVSKRRRRRLRGKMRVSPAAESIRRGLQQAISIVGAEYGPEALAVLAPLIERAKLRRPFTTAELSPEQFELIERMQMDPRHEHLNRLLDD